MRDLIVNNWIKSPRIRRITSMAIAMLLFLVAFLLVLPSFINWDKYRTRLLAPITSSIDGSRVNGKISVNFLPFPKIILQDVDIGQSPDSDVLPIIQKSNLELGMSFWQLLKGHFYVNSLTIVGGVINLNIVDGQHNNWDGYLNNSKVAIKDIEFENSSINYLNQGNVMQALSQVSAKVSIGKNKIKLNGKIAGKNKEKLQLNLAIDDFTNGKVKGKISSESFELTLDGQASVIENNIILNGKAKFNINSLVGFNDNYLSEVIPFIELINSNEKATISSDFSFSKNKISFENIDFQSPSIVASGKVINYLDKRSLLDVYIAINELNLNKLFAASNQDVDIAESLLKDSLQLNWQKTSSSIELLSNKDALVYIDLKKLTYNDQSLSDIILNLESRNGSIELYPTKINLPYHSTLQFSGLVNNNHIRSKFEGDIFLNSQEIGKLVYWLNNDIGETNAKYLKQATITSHIIITPRSMTFEKLEAEINQNSMGGAFTLRLSENPTMDAELHIKQLNLDQHGISSTINGFLQNITDVKNAEGFLSNFKWLRKIPMVFDLNISAEHLIYNSKIINEFASEIKLFSGYLGLNLYNFETEYNKISGAASLDIRALRPKINLDLKGDLFDTRFTELFAVAPITTQNNDKSAVDDNTQNWSKNSFNFYNIDKIDGDIKLNFNKFIMGLWNFEDFNFKGNLSNRLLTVEKVTSKVFDGKLELQAALNLDPMFLTLAFALNSAKADQLITTMFGHQEVDSGYISMSGSLSTQGSSPHSAITNLEANFALAGIDIGINNFNLDGLIKSCNNNKIYNQAELSQLENSAFSGRSVLNNISGKFVIKEGFMQTSSFNLSNSRMQGVLNGNVDLVNSLLNVMSEMVFIPRLNAGQISLKLQFIGSTDNPKKEFNIEQLKQYLQLPNRQ